MLQAGNNLKRDQPCRSSAGPDALGASIDRTRLARARACGRNAFTGACWSQIYAVTIRIRAREGNQSNPRTPPRRVIPFPWSALHVSLHFFLKNKIKKEIHSLQPHHRKSSALESYSFTEDCMHCEILE